MWLLDYVLDALAALGLWTKEAKLLFLGLDNAGKSTLLRRLTSGGLAQLAPTAHPHSESLRVGSVEFATFDLGGHVQARRLWAEYSPAAGGIVFIVDAAAARRLPEARAELHALLALPALDGVPFAVLGNKIDRADAVSEHALRAALGVMHHEVPVDRELDVFMCSVVMEAGYQEAFKWLAKRI